MRIVKCILAIAVLFGICYVHSSEPVAVKETDIGELVQEVVVPTQLPLKEDTTPVLTDDLYYGMHISPEEEYYTVMFARF